MKKLLNLMKIREEASRCLLCIDAPCTEACPSGLDPARALRAIRFDNEPEAGRWLGAECASCDAPCQKKCICPEQPLRIREVAADVQTSADEPVPDAALPDLSIEFCGIRCENPFFLASSAVCTNFEMVARAFDLGWAGVCFKTITLSEIKEVSPRFDAVRNIGEAFTGFRNMEQLSENTASENFSIIRRLKDSYPDKIVVASIMGENEDQWIELARGAEQAGADMIELNFSCPQMKYAGMGSDVGQNPELVMYYSSFVKKTVQIPVIAKMTPNITHISQPAMSAYFAGCDGISAINTIKSITMDEKAMVSGKRTVSGYSGNAIKPIALRYIYEMASNPLLNKGDQKLQLSGIGGIETWRDALEFIQLGCRNVQICTSVMQYGYRVIDDLKLGLQSYMHQHGIKSLDKMVGSELHTVCNANGLDRDTKIFPKWDYSKCVGCGRCFLACSDAGHQAIVFEEGRRPRMNGRKCVGCHLCRLVCPAGAIGMTARTKLI